MNQTALDTIKRFVARHLSPREFRDRLYSDDSFEALLTDDPDLEPVNYVYSSGSAYHFVISQNFDDPGGILCAQEALCDFMDRNNVEYSRTDRYSEFYDLILDAQPEWLAVDSQYVADAIMPDAGGRSGSELQKWLAAALRSRFRYVGAPPRWVQPPVWPIGENGPLVFLGQLAIKDYFQDNAAAYVFHDQHSGRCETIIH